MLCPRVWCRPARNSPGERIFHVIDQIVRPKYSSPVRPVTSGFPEFSRYHAEPHLKRGIETAS